VGGIVTAWPLDARQNGREEDAMSEIGSFGEFMERREQAAKAFVRGEAAPLEAMVAQADPATFFGPLGGHQAGAALIARTYARDAARFRGGETLFEVLHHAASGDLGYWVGIQRAKAGMDEVGPERTFDLRVTEIFRRENGGWKMIHRHADALAEAKRPGG
jgi:ketosteroid isomerase-like protein